jgi:hypothetical protein
MTATALLPHLYLRKVRDTVAIQYDGTDASWAKIEVFALGFTRRNEFGHLWIETPSGPNTLAAGDWVGTAGPGDFYVIGAENFDRLYDVSSGEPL